MTCIVTVEAPHDPFPRVAPDGNCPGCGGPIFQDSEPPYEWYCADRYMPVNQNPCTWTAPAEPEPLIEEALAATTP